MIKMDFKKIVTFKPWIVFLFAISIGLKNIFGIYWIIIWCSLFTFWTLNLGDILYTKLRNKSILNIKQFKLQIYYVLFYSIFIIIFFVDKNYQIDIGDEESQWQAWAIIPLHLLMMFCIIHTIYFLSKCITVLRENNESTGLYMLGFWFFPIGIWIIQPHIIDLVEQ